MLDLFSAESVLSRNGVKEKSMLNHPRASRVAAVRERPDFSYGLQSFLDSWETAR